ncbi:MAG: triose-phosphate isomerase [Desulfovibrio sp.]|jgi:triosephosphate isomerase|nr:triose-phosphate isomerase [Desulfovibrio sp.]
MQLLIAANWKMYKTGEEAVSTLADLGRLLPSPPGDRQVVVFVPFTALAQAARAAGPGLALGAQNCYPAEEGAFTGEISPAMIRAAGGTWVLAGHSERRSLFRESDDFVGRKTAFALRAGLQVILCVGETLEERDSGGLRPVLERQMRGGLDGVDPAFLPSSLAVAYEPVWAIGSGRVAGREEILEAHGLIRSLLENRFGAAGRGARILYGGSVKPDNAGSVLGLDNVNGVLVGGASLRAESFSAIARAPVPGTGR